jgi:plasmid stability protein
MRTLYLRNVPDEVVERLERLAARQGMSVSAVALRELTEASHRADNARLLAELPDRDIAPHEIVEGLDAERSAR